MITGTIKEKLGPFGEIFAYVASLVGLFMFFHHENVILTQRVDDALYHFHRSIDEAHKRTDMLHHEFIELLKEKNK